MWMRGVIVLAALALGGCASLFKMDDFARAGPGQLVLGQSSEQEVERFVQRTEKVYPKERIGEKYNGQVVVRKSYWYAPDSAPTWGVWPQRQQDFYFFQDRLAGYVFQSSLAEESTNFDESKRIQIVPGKTTREEVIRLLGQPAGEYAYPLVSKEGERAMVYAYSEMRFKWFILFRLPFWFHKELMVGLDEAGRVTSVNFRS